MTVSFSGTTQSVIQSNNVLGVGICAQGPDSRYILPHTVVDWGYSFLLVLNGSWSYPYIEGIGWRCWEWGRYGFWPLEQPSADLVSSWIWYYPTVLTANSNVTLCMSWSLNPNRLNYYATIDGTDFTLYSYVPSEPEQLPYFMTGYAERQPTWLGGWVEWFQFPGVWSVYNIGHGGWHSSVNHPCFQACSDLNWYYVEWAYAIDGLQAFFDNTVSWGGQIYDHAQAFGSNHAAAFSYGETTSRYTELWARWHPPACPYVCTWGGYGYLVDNNILPTSERNPGTDVNDRYRLEQPLLPIYRGKRYSLYSLQIREFENEHDYLDQVTLIAVNHSRNTKIAVSPSGEILTYSSPSPPYACVDDLGNDRLSEIRDMDGNVSEPHTFFYGEKGSYLVINFGRVAGDNAKLILRSDMKCEDISVGCCIEVQVLNDSEFETVSVVAPREYWATEAVNLKPYVVTGQELTVRLSWTLPHRLDYVGLDATPEENFSLRNATLVSAIHSTKGNALLELTNNDQVYAELVPGQAVQLMFLVEDFLDEQESFLFCSEGHYNPMT